MTSNTLPLHHRFMLEFIAGRIWCDLLMAVQAHLPGLALKELILVGTMGSMAGIAIALGEWRMCGLQRLFADQRLMAGQAEFALIRRQLQQPGDFSTVRHVAARAFTAGKRSMLSEKTFFRSGFLMTAVT